jgi:VWFA-related protein
MRALFFLALAAAAGQAPSPQDPAPAFRAGTRVVEVTLAATQAPNKLALRDLLTPPVNDLHASDLRLFDNGVEQNIASFEKQGQRGAPASANPEPQPLFIIVLDSRHTGWVDQIYGRKGAIEMLSKLPPGDRIAVFAADDQLRLLHDFSTDYGSLRATIGKYDKEPHANSPITSLRDLDDRVLGTLQAMTRIARITKSYPGKKILLWVAAGVPAPISLHTHLVLAMRELAAANVVLYTVSPSGLGAMNPGGHMTDLTELTGGLEFGADNNVGGLIRKALEDGRGGSGSGNYVLTFVPKEYQEDGSFHELRLTTSRKRVDLRYRQGYLADHR